MPRKKQQRADWGSVTEIDKGKRYRLRYWAKDDNGIYRRCSTTVRGTRRDAYDKLAALRLDHSTDAPCPTVGDLWLKFEHPRLLGGVKDGTISIRTLAAYERNWKADVSPRWSDIPCKEVKPFDIQEWLLEMTHSMGSISKAVLCLVLDHAVMLDLIDVNPAARKYRFGRDTRRKTFAYTNKQLTAIEKAIRGTVAEVPFLLSAHAGLRVGEACGMRVADVEFRDHVAALHVRVQLTQKGVVTDRLKTKGSYRTVGLPEPWSNRLREIVDSLPEYTVYLNDNGLGEPVKRRTVAGWWKRRIEESDVPYQPMQVLRPTFQTNLHWSGVPIEKTSRILGHASTATTIESYDRPNEDDLINVVVAAHHKEQLGQLGTKQ